MVKGCRTVRLVEVGRRIPGEDNVTHPIHPLRRCCPGTKGERLKSILTSQKECSQCRLQVGW